MRAPALRVLLDACVPIRRLAATDLLSEAWSLRHNVIAYDAFYVAAARLYDAQVLTADGPPAPAPQLELVIENARF